jgi:isoleucyl-tRNA synthetase
MFQPFPEKFTYSELEQDILEFWSKEQVFEKSVTSRDAEKSYTFYEGPPTVNGKPGIHHVMARTLKDVVCRYKTLTGFRVNRKAGWDTHGLPVEIALEKQLGFAQKSDIDKYGVANFNQKAKELVYGCIDMQDGWRTLTERMGYWINLDEAYITCENNYIESVWWSLSEFYKKNLVYKGFKIVPQCPHCETPLSSHELALGYADVQDMNVYVKFKIKNEDANFLVWTTTPWTLISNVALAVHPNVDYVKIESKEHGFMYLAKERLSVISEEYTIVKEMKGADLLGMEYERLFDYIPVEKKAFYVVDGTFVTTEDGSGIVHVAPAFGVDDYELLKKFDLPFVLPVTPGGRFTDEVSDFAGRIVKTVTFTSHKEEGVDKDVIIALKHAGRIYRSAKDYTHSYPHCWRCDNPLIYYARDSWYIRTTDFANRMIELNTEIGWYPPEVGTGRFGKWLEDNKDWALSRDRYWGTPLPIWVSEDGTDTFCIGSIDELADGWIEEDGELVRPKRDEIDLHKPYVDRIIFQKNGMTYRRTPELIDVWFDSGAMPFAQFHYPFENKELFENNFPADFICEGIDQTRGWFYTMHAISTALFDKPAFKNLIVNELILDKNGQKMSKSKGNVVDPFYILDKYGADATRWYLVINSPPWRQTTFNEKDIEGVQKNFFRALTNTYQFFAMYANVDGYSGTEEQVPLDSRPEIDRWILSEINDLTKLFSEAMEGYDLTKAARAISDFTIDQLSNWYVRRNRRRFWKGDITPDKLAAYQTLHSCMLRIAELMTPFAPFLSETLYQKLKHDDDKEVSVHLRVLEVAGTIDRKLLRKMHDAQRVVYLARNLREKSKVKTRQPLSRLLIATLEEELKEDIRTMNDIILDETNIKNIEFIDNDSNILKKSAKPNFKSIGPKFGKMASKVAAGIKLLSNEQIASFEEQNSIKLDIEGESITIDEHDVEILHEDIEGWTIGADGNLVVALDSAITPELEDEGIARELVSKIQQLRKDNEFEITDRIVITYSTESDRLKDAIINTLPYIQNETLATGVKNSTSFETESTRLTINEYEIDVEIERT